MAVVVAGEKGVWDFAFGGGGRVYVATYKRFMLTKYYYIDTCIAIVADIYDIVE